MINPMTVLTKITSISLIAIGLYFTSCNGQSTDSTSINHNTNIAKGSAVSELGRNIRCIFQDKNGNFWFGSDGQGVYRYDGINIILFTTKDGLCDNQIQSIQEDKSGNIWFGTAAGVCSFDGQTFHTLSDKEKFQFGIGKTTKREWKKQSEDLWFVAQDGLYRYDGRSLNYLQLPKTNLDAAYYAKYPNGAVSPYNVYSIFKDSKGNLWFGTEYLGVCRFDGKSFTWFNEKGLGGAAVRAIFEDKNGNFWFSNNGFGVFYYDGKRLTNFTAEKGLGHPDYIRALKEGDFASARALGAKGNLASIMSISDDHNGDIWIATFETGLWRYDGKNVTNYTVKDGLPGDSIMAIYKDKKGELWFGTQGEGVCRFNGKTFTRFTIK
jgi:ligand-binding sensor domain-containing protein